jgi:hypothetical protein
LRREPTSSGHETDILTPDSFAFRDIGNPSTRPIGLEDAFRTLSIELTPRRQTCAAGDVVDGLPIDAFFVSDFSDRETLPVESFDSPPLRNLVTRRVH